MARNQTSPSSTWDVLEAMAPLHLRPLLQRARALEAEADAALAAYMAALAQERHRRADTDLKRIAAA